ncbi:MULTISPECIES: DUF2079 domain-containing protein [unclassified Streptomyces]|uniref:DUF2079 domain-containing protein n=1 Tax=unclassified Streptomyces TaxID=2593676 RepID=UPI000DC7713A|nr:MULTISPECIES: DUF2079 domain-containing protein [unclassified Streptomyces]AWZ06057.1 hypothetical protein DRB89_17125 [Streptomyces sp. ICC4]AWZ14901.1 hypothetical protein DRB96_24540 [Streptomyces sp. ICC1]
MHAPSADAANADADADAADAAVLPPQQAGPVGRQEAEPSPESAHGIPWWAWTMAGGLFLLYTALSLRTHGRLHSHSFDLAIFEQAVRSYAVGRLPVSEVKGPDFPVLGDHFSPVLAVLAPLYRIWPSPRTLLVAQAALIAVSVLPLTLWARRTLGGAAAAVIGLCYGLSWGIANAIGFDFHEWAFAVPLLACSLSALGAGRLRAAACWALPLVLVKEDLGLTVAAIGAVIAWRGGRGGRRLGIATAVAGAACTLLAMVVVLPALNPSGSYFYASFLGGGADSGGGAGGGFTDLLAKVTVGLVTPETKAVTLVLVLAPTLFLALRSPLVLIAVPGLLWRGVSDQPVHWGTGYHYSLTVMPIVFAAFVDALGRRATTTAGLRRYLAGAAGVCVLLLPAHSLGQLGRPDFWRTEPRVAVAQRLMDRIPDGATVQASDGLVPHLANRTSVSVYGWPASRDEPEWILVDTGVAPARRWPLSAMEEYVALDGARARGYRTVAEQDGFVLLGRRS